jgi:hypothetical protein
VNEGNRPIPDLLCLPKVQSMSHEILGWLSAMDTVTL